MFIDKIVHMEPLKQVYNLYLANMKPPKTQAPSNLSFVIRFVHCEKYCESLIISIDSKWENRFESIYS